MTFEPILDRAVRRWELRVNGGGPNGLSGLGPGDAGVILNELDRRCADENMTQAEAAASLSEHLFSWNWDELEKIALAEQWGQRPATTTHGA